MTHHDAVLPAPHHDGSALYVADDAPEVGDRVTVRLRVPRTLDGAKVFLRSVEDGEAQLVECQVDAEDPAERWWRADLPIRTASNRYRFLVHGAGTSGWVTGAGFVDWDPTDHTDFRIVAEPPPPAWLAGATLYQVFPDRFRASGAGRPLPSWARPARWDDPVVEHGPDAMAQLYGGDLDGIAAGLDHVVSLGATGVYLTPIFPARSNHRYDSSTFDAVDPVLGGDEALARLTDAAHRRGLRVLGDLTTNHTGSTHEWFTAAQADAGSVEAGFYLFEQHPGRYASWNDVPSLPKLDHRDAELRRRLYEGPDSVVGRWLRPPWSLDGWRIDAANMTGRHGDVDVNDAVARAIRRTVREAGPDRYLLAEHMHDHTTDLDGHGWDGVMSYAGFHRPVHGFANAAYWRSMTGRAAARTMLGFLAGVPWRCAVGNLNLLGSHDTVRLASELTDREARRVAVGLLATWVGVPSVFAGDEVGVQGATMHTARAPFPWDESAWDHAELATYRQLLGLRRRCPALQRGGLRVVDAGDRTITFLRECAEQRLLVHAAIAPHEPVRLASTPFGLRAGAASLIGEDDLALHDGSLLLPADGPHIGVWELA